MSRGRKSGSKEIAQSWREIYFKNVGFYFRKILFDLGQINKSGTESALQLLSQIKIEKERLGKKDKPLPPIKVEEIPFKIPDNWIWVRLGEMSINLDGARKPIALSDRENRNKVYDYYGASGVIDKIDGYTHKGELLLIGEDGANLVSRSTPVAFIAKGEFWVNNHAHVLDTVHRVTLDFLCAYINSIDLKPFVTGGFQPKLSQGNLNLIPVPLPPLNEQEKIISFLNTFESERYEHSHPNFNKTIEKEIVSLQCSQLVAAELKVELKLQLKQLENLNQAILQEAVQGKLVKQDRNDEPASKLLTRIRVEKAKSGIKEKLLPPIEPREIPFEIPENWVWCRLGEICTKITDGTHHSPTNTNSGDYKYVTAKNIKNEGIDLSNITYVSKAVHKEIYSRCNPSFGDILYIKDGATTGVVTVNNLSEEFSMLSSVALLKLPNLLHNTYLMFAMRSPSFYKATRDDMYGVAITRVTLQKINNLTIPLPPLSEQKRIAAEIEKQFIKTKQLKEHIIANQRTTEKLIKALLHKTVDVSEPSSLENDERVPALAAEPEVPYKNGKIVPLSSTQGKEENYFVKRKVLATYIINQSLDDSQFGDVKFEKLLHLSDYFAIKRNLGQKFYKKVAGPLDNAFTTQYFKQIEQSKWFNRKKAGRQFFFSAGVNHNKSLKTYDYFSDEELEKVNKIISYFKKSDYEKPEIVSTLYAVWNNRLIKREPISDAALIADFYEWDDAKKKYSEERLTKALQWMKSENFIPDGWGNYIDKPKAKKK